MPPRSGVRLALWVLAAASSFAGIYLGVVVALLSWWEGDTDINGDPVSLASRLFWVVLGLAVLVLSLLASRWCIRRRPGARRSIGPADPG